MQGAGIAVACFRRPASISSELTRSKNASWPLVASLLLLAMSIPLSPVFFQINTNPAK